MPSKRVAVAISTAVTVAVLIIAAGLVAVVYWAFNNQPVISSQVHATSSPATSSTRTASTVCSITGQPAGFSFRVVSGSNRTGLLPVVGAEVKATNKPAYCNGSPAAKQATVAFTTNSTMWHSLDSENNAGYTISVSYSGQNYTVSADLRPVSMTCASLFLPSGQSNSTITELQSTCQ